MRGVRRLAPGNTARIGPVAPEESGHDRVLEALAEVDRSAARGPQVLRVEAREDLIVSRDVTTLIAPN